MKKLLIELYMWQNVLNGLLSVPNDCRSQNHSAYLSEVEQRIYECNDLIKHYEDSH